MHSIATIIPATSPANADLTTLALAKAALDIASDDTTQDAEISRQITSFSEQIAVLCGRTLARSTVSQLFILHRRELVRSLALQQSPVNGEIVVSVDGTAIDATHYDLDADTGILWHRHRYWRHRITVLHSGGYDLPSGAPASLSRACIELIKQQAYFGGRDPSIRAMQHGDERAEFWSGPRGDATDAIPSFVLDMIAPYKYLAV